MFDSKSNNNKKIRFIFDQNSTFELRVGRPLGALEINKVKFKKDGPLIA